VNGGPQDSTDRDWGRLRLPASVFILALVIRLAYLWQIRHIPFFDYPVGDSQAYYEWAGRIARGDWLGSEVFYQAPLYPYFLGMLRSAGIGSIAGLYIVQAILSAFSCILVYCAGSLLFSRRAGAAAGILLAVYPPAIFFDGVLQKCSLDLLLMSGALALLAWLATYPGGTPWAKWLGVGMLLGGLSLTRENALILVPVAVVWLLVHFSTESIGRRLLWLTALTGGITLVLVPVAARNLKVGGDFTLTTSQMGPNFYIGNNANADGTYKALRPDRGDPQFERRDATELAEQAAGRKLTPSEVSHYWMRRAWDFIRSQPADWLELTARKVLLTWNAYEVPDVEDYYIYREYSPLLHMLGTVFHFGILCPLACAGIVLTWPQRRRLWLFYAMLVAFSTSVVAFYVFARYRFTMVPAMALFAGAAIVQAWPLALNRKYAALAWSGGILLVAGIITNWPPPIDDYWPPSRYNLAFVQAQKKDVAGAEANYRLEIQRDPHSPKAQRNLADLLRQKGALKEAEQHYRLAIGERPDWSVPWINLGITLAMMNDLAGAERCFREALKLDPANEHAKRNLTKCLEAQKAASTTP
jgi:tetratricopeptide (TPR) repeat protein